MPLTICLSVITEKGKEDLRYDRNNARLTDRGWCSYPGGQKKESDKV